MNMRSIAGLLATGGLLAIAVPAAAQRPLGQDTVISIEPMVVTADRAETPLSSSVAAVSVLTAEQLAAVPQRTLPMGCGACPDSRSSTSTDSATIRS